MSHNKKEALCEGCLSRDRKLRSIEQYYDLFLNIFIEGRRKTRKKSKIPNMCWECVAVLRNIHKFREKVKQANDYLNDCTAIKKENIVLSALNLCTLPICTYDENTKEANVNDNNHKTDIIDTKLDIINEKNEITEDLIKNEPEFDAFDYLDDVESNHVIKDESVRTEYEEFNDSKKLKIKSHWREKYNNVRYKVIDISDDELKRIRYNCKEVYIDDSERNVWFEKAKTARNYRTMEYKCETCISGFSKREQYDLHVKAFHTKAKNLLQCDICKKRLRKNRLQYHIRKHNVKYVCSVCDYECHKYYELCSHLIRNHKRIVECLECGRQFRDITECNLHYIKSHKTFICNDCGIKYKLKKRLIRHIRIRHLEAKCKRCNKVYGTYYSLQKHLMEVHMKSISEDTYCVECDIYFNNEFLLKRHLNTSEKHRPRRYPCPECGRVYHKKTTLNNHYNYIHLKKTKNYCDICKRYFLTGYRLREHKASVHENVPKVRNKVCTICGRAFTTNRILQNHIRTHTGERPFHCEYCASTFAQKTALVSHLRSIHKLTK